LALERRSLNWKAEDKKGETSWVTTKSTDQLKQSLANIEDLMNPSRHCKKWGQIL
jgi:hypothetical protein